MTFGQRLKELRQQKNMSQADLAKFLNLSAGTISLYEHDNRDPSQGTLRKIANFFNVTLDYLLAQTSERKSTQAPVTATEKIPVYGSIRAGMPTLAVENIIGRVWVPIEFQERYGRENLFALRINGESMNKVIPNGYAAVFAKGVGVENGDIVAVLIDGEDATIKRFEQTSQAAIFSPESWDETFKPIIFHKTEVQDFTIMGKYLFATSADI